MVITWPRKVTVAPFGRSFAVALMILEIRR